MMLDLQSTNSNNVQHYFKFPSQFMLIFQRHYWHVWVCVCECVCVCVWVSVCVCVCVCVCVWSYVPSQSRQLFCYSYIIPLSFRPLFRHSLPQSYQILKRLPVVYLTYEKVHYSFSVHDFFFVSCGATVQLGPRIASFWGFQITHN